MKKKLMRIWKKHQIIIILTALAIGISVLVVGAQLIQGNNEVQTMTLQEAMKLPQHSGDCNYLLPNGAQKDFVNTTLNKRVHWSGCFVFVHGAYGAASHSPLPKKEEGWTLDWVAIPLDVSDNQRRIIWTKETFGNANALLFGPDFATNKLVDGLAAVYLSPADQQGLGLRYPSMNKNFQGQYIQWVPQDAKQSNVDCLVFVAIHYISLQGNLGTNGGGIADMFQSGQPLETCKPLLDKP